LTAQLAGRTGGVGGGAAVNIKVAKPQVFDRILSKILGFVMVYKLYLKIKMNGTALKEQIQWILSYIQGESTDVWKENILENLEAEGIEFELVGEFLAETKKKFGKGDEESVKVTELKRMEQGGRLMEEFIQDFKRVARESRCHKLHLACISTTSRLIFTN